MDTTDPVVTFSPSSGSFAAGALSVTIDWSDGYALNHNSRAITFANASGTQNVTGNFSYSTSNGTTAVSMGTVSIGTGTNTLTATICDMSEYGPNCSTQTATFSGPAPPPPSATITAETPAAVVAAGTRGALRYRLTNTGTAQGTFSMGASCPAGFADCAPSETSVMLSAGAAAWVDVSFTTPASPSNGPVQLATLSGTVSGTTTVTVPAVPSPGYPGDAASLLRIQRDACVVVSTGPGTASECGDLRVAHALPSVRVLNKARTPVLTYNSDHAWPNPIVATQFTGPAGTVPDSIRAVLLVNGTQVAQRRWKGWGASQTRRIALSFLAADTTFKTGVYAYSLVVTAEWLNGTQAPVADASRTGRMILVNRSRSPFGAGWWLSGVEQVFPLTDTEKLWVGGDGSARLYQGTSAAGPWTADAYDGVDVLTAGAGGLGYVRLLPGGAKVHFSSSGYHTATENALGHVTQFVWLPEGTPEEMRLKSIVLPSASAHPEMLSYLFEYGTLGPGCTTSTTALSRVRSPAPDSGYQDSWLCGDVSRRVTRISDPTPGSTFVTFGYYLSTRWITRRTDRRGVAQTLGYSKVRFHNAIQPLSAGVTANTVVGAVQTLGMNGVSVNADSVHIVFDGPRPGAGGLCDCLWWKVDRWGAPVSMRNILSQVTTIRRGDGRWPGLVTETVAPNGFKTTAQYDALGYLASTTAWSPYGDLRNATTILEWDAAAAAPTRIVSPEGEVTTTGYTAGRRAWEQVGASTLRRVNYQYHDASHATAPGLLRAVVAPGGATESIVYDVRGNLAASISPLGWRTESLSDRLGRVIRTRVPVDSAHTVWQQDTTIYDSVGRVRETIATGPEWRGAPPQSLHVRNHYDVASNLEMVERWSVPDAADVDTLRTRWEYDLAGRQIVEIAPDGMRDSTFYDQAGNVVRVRTRRFAESRAATQSDSAAYIWMRYDALNRLTLRIFPPVVYASRTTQIGSVVQRYPRHPTEGTGHRIPADTASYTYDPATGLQ
ncbi:MAG TPA: hypothetical protein VE871_02980, partial [Longimicrobium sp.]|nr:hypothetical protein [Longimicrobium sp.]